MRRQRGRGVRTRREGRCRAPAAPVGSRDAGRSGAGVGQEAPERGARSRLTEEPPRPGKSGRANGGRQAAAPGWERDLAARAVGPAGPPFRGRRGRERERSELAAALGISLAQPPAQVAVDRIHRRAGRPFSRRRSPGNPERGCQGGEDEQGEELAHCGSSPDGGRSGPPAGRLACRRSGNLAGIPAASRRLLQRAVRATPPRASPHATYSAISSPSAAKRRKSA